MRQRPGAAETEAPAKNVHLIEEPYHQKAGRSGEDVQLRRVCELETYSHHGDVGSAGPVLRKALTAPTVSGTFISSYHKHRHQSSGGVDRTMTDAHVPNLLATKEMIELYGSEFIAPRPGRRWVLKPTSPQASKEDAAGFERAGPKVDDLEQVANQTASSHRTSKAVLSTAVVVQLVHRRRPEYVAVERISRLIMSSFAEDYATMIENVQRPYLEWKREQLKELHWLEEHESSMRQIIDRQMERTFEGTRTHCAWKMHCARTPLRDTVEAEEEKARCMLVGSEREGFAGLLADHQLRKDAMKLCPPVYRSRNEMQLVDDPHVRSRGITLASYALPGMSCQESAIRVAAYLVQQTTIPFKVREGMTLTQFVDYVAHLAIEVPIFVANPASKLPKRADGSLRYVYTQVNKAALSQDRWSIVFFPEGDPHYTVLQLTDNDYEVRRAIVCTTLPLCPTDGIFWRAVRTPQNSEQLDVMMACGLACDCPISPFQCKHELDYACDERIAVGVDCPGWKIGEVCANPMSTWMTVPIGTDVHVISPCGQIFEERTCQNVPSSYGYAHVKAHVGDLAMSRFSLRVFERRWRVHHTWMAPTVVCANLFGGFYAMTSAILARLFPEAKEIEPQANCSCLFEALDHLALGEAVLEKMGKLESLGERVREVARCVYGQATPIIDRCREISNAESWATWVNRGVSTHLRLHSKMYCRAVAGIVGVAAAYACYRQARWLIKPTRCTVTPMQYTRAHPHEIPNVIPDYRVFVNKISTVKEPTEAVVLDALRRHNQLMGNRHPINSSVVRALVLRTAATVGQTQVENAPWACQTCGRRARLYQHECKDCKSARKLPMFSTPTYTLEAGTRHVGFVGIYASQVQLPDVPFREGIKCTYRGITVNSVADANRLYAKHQLMNVCYGRLCAFMIMGCHVSCYPRGIETGLMAFVGRMTPELGLQFNRDLIPLMVDLLKFIADMAQLTVGPLERWTDEQVLEHQRDGKKREILRQAQRAVFEHGPLPMSRLRQYDCFAKFEKHIAVEWNDGWTLKKKLVPRLINSPDVQVNAILAPYTLPMLKWVGSACNIQANVFYAGGATPQELNIVLNRLIDDFEFFVEDDISMIDASHTEGSFEFHARVRKALWPDLPKEIERLFVALQKITVKARAGGVRGEVPVANASGIPMTSYNNSLICVVLRTLAIAYASDDCEIGDHQRIAFGARLVLHASMQLFAGDDGLVGINRCSLRDPSDPLWLTRYVEFWATAGFKVSPEKVRILTRDRRRMITFLGMRPFWSGQMYEWGPEIARRLKTMFWQLDNAMQPFVWAKGVAQSLLIVGKHVPVIREISDAVLHLAPGPIGDTVWTNEYSTFRNYAATGDITARTIGEFCVDYGVTPSEYEDFRALLRSQRTVQVDLHHIVLRKVLDHE